MIGKILAVVAIMTAVYWVGAVTGERMAYTGEPPFKHGATVEPDSPSPPTMPDGTWRVGRDMPHGWWGAPEVDTPGGCHWRVTVDDFTVDGDDKPVGRVGPVVRLEPGVTFTSTGCGTWTLVR